MKKRLAWALALVAALLVFGCALAESAGSPGLDVRYLLALQSLRESAGHWLTQAMKFFTLLGESAVPVLVSAILLWSFDRKSGERVLLFDAAGHWVNQVIKITCCVYRPWIRDSRVTPVPEAMTTATGYSFPSGHTANAGSWTMGLGLYLRQQCASKQGRVWTMAIWAVVWLLIGFSRNFLGVHTPQDVAVMIALMLPILWLSQKALDWTDKGGKREWIFSGAMAAMGAALVIYALLKSYPVDYAADGTVLVDPQKMIRDTFSTAGLMVGYAIGFLCGRKWPRFRTEGSVWQRIARSVPGCALLLGLNALSKPLISLLGGQWGKFTVAFLSAILVLGAWPAVIGTVQRARAKKGSASA